MAMRPVGTEVLPLWHPEPPPLPAAPAPTSRAAAKAHRSKASGDRERILAEIRRHGGLACFQIEAITGIPGNTARPRLCELEERDQIHKSATRTACTPAGHEAVIYEAGPKPLARP